jgi:hypothetical protein
MTTTTVHARGHHLSHNWIEDGWLGYTNTPECTDHPQYEDLIEALAAATQQAGNAMLPEGFSWHPFTSEIIGPVDASLPDGFDAEEFARAASDAVDYSTVEAATLDYQLDDLKVQIEVSTDGQIWQAVDSPEPLRDAGFSGDAAQQGDAVAEDYADQQEHDGAADGLQVRAVITVTSEDGTATTIATSTVHTVEQHALTYPLTR